MDTQQFPKFNVAAQWMSLSALFCVQAVEIAENQLQQLLGGHYAVRVRMLDKVGEATLAFTVSGDAASELAELIDKAVEQVKSLQPNE